MTYQGLKSNFQNVLHLRPLRSVRGLQRQVSTVSEDDRQGPAGRCDRARNHRPLIGRFRTLARVSPSPRACSCPPAARTSYTGQHKSSVQSFAQSRARFNAIHPWSVRTHGPSFGSSTVDRMRGVVNARAGRTERRVLALGSAGPTRSLLRQAESELKLATIWETSSDRRSCLAREFRTVKPVFKHRT